MVKIFKAETVISCTEIEAPTPEKALQFARAAEGMPNAPTYTEVSRRGTRLSLSEDIGKRQKADEGDDSKE